MGSHRPPGSPPHRHDTLAEDFASAMTTIRAWYAQVDDQEEPSAIQACERLVLTYSPTTFSEAADMLEVVCSTGLDRGDDCLDTALRVLMVFLRGSAAGRRVAGFDDTLGRA